MVSNDYANEPVTELWKVLQEKGEERFAKDDKNIYFIFPGLNCWKMENSFKNVGIVLVKYS